VSVVQFLKEMDG